MVDLTVDVPYADVDIEVVVLNEKLDVDVETMVIEVVLEKLRLEKGGVDVSIVLPGLGMTLVENRELASSVEVLLLIVVVPRGIDVSPTDMDAIELPKAVEVLLMPCKGHTPKNGSPTCWLPLPVGSGC